MDPLHLSLSLGPLGVYLMVVGTVNLRRRPMLVSGTSDFAAITIALSGLVVAGPMELFMPEVALAQFGPYIWLLLISFYVLCVALIVLLARPRLVVYNVSMRQLRPLLTEVAQGLDAEARWAGDSLAMPGLGVQLHLEPFATMRNVSLLAVGRHQDLNGWAHLSAALRENLSKIEVRANPRGYSLTAFGVLMLCLVVWKISVDPQQVAQQLREMLRL